MSKSKNELLPIWWMPVFVFLLEGKPIKHKGIKLSNGTVALVLGVMYYFYNMSDGICKASIQTISKKVGVSVKTVERCIHALEDMGFVDDLTPHRKHVPHEYRVMEDAIRTAYYVWYNTSEYFEKKKKVASNEQKEPFVSNEQESSITDKMASEDSTAEMIKKLKRTLNRD
jgi:DNA-binding transcriptional regulator YhcF (GntR family)